MTHQPVRIRDQSSIFQVYLLVNKMTARMYAGITSRCVCLRYREHVRDVKNGRSSRRGYAAMRADGHDALVVVHYASARGDSNAFSIEAELIEEFNLLDPEFGYNSGSTAEFSTSAGAKNPFSCVCHRLRAQGCIVGTLDEALS